MKDLLTEKDGPITAGDTRYMRFFPANASYRVVADYTPTYGARPFLVPTHSGKQKAFKEYGLLKFTVNDTAVTLHLYQSVDLSGGGKKYLFLPFNDMTNYVLTYAGGRYLEIDETEILGGHVTLDFNKCYNPYCAYKDGYSCPIPPKENSLPIAIFAGEKMFAKNIGN